MALYDLTISKQLAQFLLQIKAIQLNPSQPFLWASGWKSPIYCDNRKILSYPSIRTYVRDAFVSCVRSRFPDADVIAGVATGAIAHGVLVAQQLGIPFIYVRHEAKSHGLRNQIEGHLEQGQKVVVIEDLISTGGSSLSVVQTLREAGAQVPGLIAIFSYEFEVAKTHFQQASCPYWTLTDYPSLLQVALDTNDINSEHLTLLQSWRLDPQSWGENI